MAEYTSTHVIESLALPGVKLEVRKVSFGLRLELLRLLGQRVEQIQFFNAGQPDESRIEAVILERELEAALVKWGLAAVHGLTVDGEPATVTALVEKGPEELVREAVQTIVRQLGLSADERKN